MVSTQVIQEFFVTVTRKLPEPMTSEAAADIVSDLLQWNYVVIEGPTIMEAIDLHRRYGYSFWDSLIAAAAQKAGCRLLLSEDLASGHALGGLVIENPFAQ